MSYLKCGSVVSSKFYYITLILVMIVAICNMASRDPTLCVHAWLLNLFVAMMTAITMH